MLPTIVASSALLIGLPCASTNTLCLNGLKNALTPLKSASAISSDKKPPLTLAIGFLFSWNVRIFLLEFWFTSSTGLLTVTTGAYFSASPLAFLSCMVCTGTPVFLLTLRFNRTPT